MFFDVRCNFLNRGWLLESNRDILRPGRHAFGCLTAGLSNSTGRRFVLKSSESIEGEKYLIREILR